MLHNTDLVCICLEVCFIVLPRCQHKEMCSNFRFASLHKCEINSGEWKSFATAWRISTHPLRVFFFSFCSSSLLFFLGAGSSLMSSPLPASSGSSSSLFPLLSVGTSPLSLLALLSFNFPSCRFMSFLSGIGLFRMPLEPRAVAPLRGFTPLSSTSSPSSSSSSSSRSGSHQKMTSHKEVSG